jgi:hypothetical protein
VGRLRACSLAFLAASFLPVAGEAQSLWPRPLEGRGEVGLEWVRPTFADDADFGFARGVWIVDGRLKVGKRIRLIAAVPWIAVGGDSGGSTFGNPMIGVEFTDTAGAPEFTLALRRGFGDDEAWEEGALEVGGYGDLDRIEQVFPEGLIIEGVGHSRPWTGEDGTNLALRFGGTGVIIRNQYGGGGTLFLKYGFRLGHDTERVGIGVGLTGLWLVPTGGEAGSTVDQLFAEVAGRAGQVRPSLAVRIPFDDGLGEILDYALTFGVRVILP